MELYYYHAASGNFGDDLNAWFWDEVTPGWREALPDHLLVGIGTLLNDRLPLGQPKLVMGSGLGYGDGPPPAELLAEMRFAAVRGPRTAATLGLPAETGIVDPAVLIPDLEGFRDLAPRGRAIFVPHVSSLPRFNWERVCAGAGIDFVSPAGPAREVITRIGTAPLVIAESMHAAILADAFGRPWHALSISREFNDFKWGDWADSLEIALTVERPAWERWRGGRSATGPAGGPRHEALAPARNRIEHLQRRVRQQLQTRMLSAQLRRLAGRPGTLSRRAVLQARKQALRDRFATAFTPEDVTGPGAPVG